MANFFKAKAKKSVKSQEKTKLTLVVKKLDLNGCGVAYHNKKPVFINGSLPNETVEVRVDEQKNKYALAKLLTVHKKSEDRASPKCEHFTLCGGCDLQHLAYAKQLSFKQHKIIELFSRTDISVDIVKQLPWQTPITQSQWEYRRKARIGVQFDKKAHATIGFRQKSTNQLVAIKSCPVLEEPANAIFPLLKTLINQLTVKKSIGHIEVIKANNADSTAKLTLIVRQIRAINEADYNLWQAYANKHYWNLHFQYNKDEINVKNEKDENKSAEKLSYTLTHGIQIHFSYDDFIQINHHVNLAMVEQASDWLQVQENDSILDLFCGLGNFSLPLAKVAGRVVGVEGVQTMVDKALTNAKLNNIDNCRFYQADLNSEWLSNDWAKEQYNKVLLDPARAGAEQAIKQIVKLDVSTVLYVSCEPTTLANDSQQLLSHGYHIEKIGLIDMFSQTKHVETMVLFSKK